MSVFLFAQDLYKNGIQHLNIYVTSEAKSYKEEEVWEENLKVSLNFTVEEFSAWEGEKPPRVEVHVYVSHPEVESFHNFTNRYPSIKTPKGKTIDGEYIAYCKLVEWTKKCLTKNGISYISDDFAMRDLKYIYSKDDIQIIGFFPIFENLKR